MEHVSCYQGGYGPCRDIDRSWEDSVTFRLDFTHYTDTLDCLFLPFFLFPTPKPMYDMDLVWNPCTIQSRGWPLYDIYLRATITTILSIRRVTILIDLVSSTTMLCSDWAFISTRGFLEWHQFWAFCSCHLRCRYVVRGCSEWDKE